MPLTRKETYLKNPTDIILPLTFEYLNAVLPYNFDHVRHPTVIQMLRDMTLDLHLKKSYLLFLPFD